MSEEPTMELKIAISGGDKFGVAVASVTVKAPYTMAFEPLRLVDDPSAMMSYGEVLPSSEEAKTSLRKSQR